MSIQSEKALEDNLINQLVGLGYSFVKITNEAELLSNLKLQIEKHNNTNLSENEFNKVLNHLNKGNILDRAKILRDRMQLTKDNGVSIYIEFLNCVHWCQNEYQVTNQVTMEGTYSNRYDVTILVNGLPLVQIELKRRGIELKEAFNQTNRYHKHSYWASNGLFLYTQLYVISNGLNTKYYANNREQTFKQTFYWSDINNKVIHSLDKFANTFLEPCHVSKMITKYTVLSEANKCLMVLRPYQFYAVEAIIHRVKSSNDNGYIWHTTGSGKTLTSFKASQILSNLKEIDKVVFVVDRKDLDFQAIREFNSFSDGCIDGTDNTKTLVNQFADPKTNIIVTTIQKLNTAISKTGYLKKMDNVKNKKMVFIFDECHRSQFGETHQRIKSYFENVQMFGFTGTPIFAENSVKNELGKKTTKDLFGDCLHKYVITDAIRDENVLKFSVEYVGKYTHKEESTTRETKAENIDIQELLDSPQRIEKVVDFIIENHDRKTHTKAFNSMFCVSKVDVLKTYYDTFKEKKLKGEHNLKIGTIFSYTANEDDKDASGEYSGDVRNENNSPENINPHTRDILESYIGDYNEMFGTKYTTKDSQSFYDYYNNISKRVKDKELDILLVVNMFLTGFDSPKLNTLYVDKNLQYHGLIQAYSRTNRLLGELKSQGNIVCFRNLKDATDEAITLFSNKEAIETIIMKPYEDYKKFFNEEYSKLQQIAATVEEVDELESEEDKLEFVQAFRNVMRVKNILTSFTEFSYDDIDMDEQTFEDYKSKYLDIYDSIRNAKENNKVSILNDVDFELELIHRDEINVTYILNLLAKAMLSKKKDKEQIIKSITEMLSSQVDLRNKKELIEEFIDKYSNKKSNDNVFENFEQFWAKQKEKAFNMICSEEGIVVEGFNKILNNYIFTEKLPLSEEVVSVLNKKPKILERRPIVERVVSKLKQFIEIFIDGIPEYFPKSNEEGGE